METPTPTGGETKSPVTDVPSAAKAISGLLDASTLPKEPETQTATPETHPEATDKAQPEGKQATQEESQGKEEKANEEKAADAEINLSSLEELSQALDVPLDKLLELRVKTKVDGEEGEIPLAQAIKSYQLEASLNKKSMELANQRKALEAETQAKQAELDKSLTDAKSLVTMMENQVIGEFQQVDWNRLKVENPAEYAAKRIEFNERAAHVHNVKAHLQNELQRQQQEILGKQQAQLSEVLNLEQQKLLNALPEWRDEEKASSEKKKITEYLTKQGYTENDLSSLYDHRQLLMIRKAMLFDEMKKTAAPELKKVANLPKLVKPGTKPDKAQIDAQKKNEAMARLRKTGTVHDAAFAIKQLL